MARILGQCTSVTDARIHRHDEIVGMIAVNLSKSKKRLKVIKKPYFGTSERLLKPDLIIVREKDVLVIDVSVRYQDGRSLKIALRSAEMAHAFLDYGQLRVRP